MKFIAVAMKLIVVAINAFGSITRKHLPNILLNNPLQDFTKAE